LEFVVGVEDDSLVGRSEEGSGPVLAHLFTVENPSRADLRGRFVGNSRTGERVPSGFVPFFAVSREDEKPSLVRPSGLFEKRCRQ